MSTSALHALLSIIQLEKITENCYQGKSQNIGLPHVFGGQLMGQALYAATQSVSPEHCVHALHCNFLLAGDYHLPIIYEVTPLRDGRSFSTRQVIAKQNDEVLFYLTASFQLPEVGFSHQVVMPKNVPDPETLPNETMLLATFARYLPEPLQQLLLQEKPIEIRPTQFYNPLQPKPAEAEHQAWFRIAGLQNEPPYLASCLLAYASDFTFLPTALQPHGVSLLQPGMQVATLNHAIWFHQPIDFTQWLLYHVDSPIATGGRGFVRGQFFTKEGVLVASTAQEGVIRRHTLHN